MLGGLKGGCPWSGRGRGAGGGGEGELVMVLRGKCVRGACEKLWTATMRLELITCFNLSKGVFGLVGKGTKSFSPRRDGPVERR